MMISLVLILHVCQAVSSMLKSLIFVPVIEGLLQGRWRGGPAAHPPAKAEIKPRCLLEDPHRCGTPQQQTSIA